MRKLILLCVIALQACSTYQYHGYGKYSNNGMSSSDNGAVAGAFTPSSVVTSRGTYVVVPNYTTGRTQAIIQTSRGR